MSVFVLANIGLRDVLLDGQPQKPAREKGAELLERYGELKNRLSFPILLPPLVQILAEEGQIDQLFIFGTDQQDKAYRHTDTLYFAEILERAVAEKFPQIKKVRPVFIRGINPSIYDEALEFYREELPRLRLAVAEETTIYLLPTAGPPACSLGLVVQGLALFGEQCRVFYQREGEEQPRALPIEARLQETFQRQTAVHLVEQFNFHAAALACQKAGVHDPLVYQLLAYATARLWFSFDEARQVLAQLVEQTRGETRDYLETIPAELAALQEQEPTALLRELFVNARIAWENGRWLDFLTRCVRFHQIALPLAIAQMPPNTFISPVDNGDLNNATIRGMTILQMMHAVDKESAANLTTQQRTKLSQLIQASFNLAELDNLCFDLGIQYENVAGDTLKSKVTNLIQYCQRRHLLLTLIQTIAEERPQQAKIFLETFNTDSKVAQLTLALQRLESLRSIYGQTILTTGSSGITKNTITQTYTASDKVGREDNPRDDMVIVCGALGIHTENPFRRIKEIIIEELKK